MSQAKVEQYKKDKADRKNWKKKQIRKKVLGWLIAIVCVAAVAALIIFNSLPEKVKVNTGESVYDEAALAEIFGDDYDLNSLMSSINGDADTNEEANPEDVIAEAVE